MDILTEEEYKNSDGYKDSMQYRINELKKAFLELKQSILNEFGKLF